MANPVFIVGTGRSGTRSMFRMLSGMPKIEIHHEYNVLTVQKLSVMYQTKIWSPKRCKTLLKDIYEPALYYSRQPIWIDSSNKCSWIIDLLADIFPSAKFVLIVRDGRHVVPSFYYKLREEMYDDNSTEKLKNYLKNYDKGAPPPPLEKKFWWHIPIENSEELKKFEKFDRFQRCCYHWTKVNSVALGSFKKLNKDRYHVVRLEDLTSSEYFIEKMCDFIETPFLKEYVTYLTRPRNVFHPMSYSIPATRQPDFDLLCGDMMQYFDYLKTEPTKIVY